MEARETDVSVVQLKRANTFDLFEAKKLASAFGRKSVNVCLNFDN